MNAKILTVQDSKIAHRVLLGALPALAPSRFLFVAGELVAIVSLIKGISGYRNIEERIVDVLNSSLRISSIENLLLLDGVSGCHGPRHSSSLE